MNALFNRVLVVLAVFFFTTASVAAHSHYKQVSKGTEVPKVFTPEIPLYVKGAVRIGNHTFSESELEAFGKRIAELNASNPQKFGVLLLESFDDEKYTIDDHVVHNGKIIFRSGVLDGEYMAVDAAITIELDGNHEVYNQQDWAWLTVCFQKSWERDFRGSRPITYYASEQLKEWKLGVPHIWKGDLDAIMIRRLKSRQLKDAVYDAIESVNDRLERRIAAEQARKAEEKRQGLAALENAERKLAILTAALSTFRVQYPDVKGGLFFPNLSGAEANLASARAAVQDENYPQARSSGNAVLSFVEKHQNLLDEYNRTPEVLGQLKERVASHKEHMFASEGQTRFQDTAASIDAAETAHKFGRVEYLDLRNKAEGDVLGLDNLFAGFQDAVEEYPRTVAILDGLDKKLADLKSHDFAGAASDLFAPAQASIKDARTAHELQRLNYLSMRRAAEAQVQNVEIVIEDAQAAHRAFVATMITIVLIVLGIIAFVLVLLRRSSLKAQRKFEEKAGKLRSMLDQKREAQSALQEKKVETIGANKVESDLTSDTAAGSNKTEKMVDEAGMLVGDIFLMLACADKVVREAIAIATPKNPLDKLLLSFSSAKYKEAMSYLSTTPVEFNKQSGLRFALSEKKEVSEAEALWRPAAEFENFKLSFNDLQAEIGKKAKKADSLLTQISEAVEEIGPLLVNLSSILHGDEGKPASDPVNTTSLDARYDKACATWAEDGEFVLNGYAGENGLVPALDAEIDRLSEIAKRDPVTAFEEITPLAEKIDATTMAIGEIEVVAEAYSGIVEGFTKIGEADINAAWIKSRYNEILDACDAHFGAITQATSVSKLQLSAAADIARLEKRVGAIAKLATDTRGQLEDGIKAQKDRVTSTRNAIAAKIEDLKPKSVLTERDEAGHDLNPNTHLSSARRFLATCLEELEDGDVEGASEAYKRGSKLLAQATAIVDKTIEANEAYSERVSGINDEGASLLEQVPAHQEILAGIKAEFAPSVLRLTAQDDALPDANGTIEDNFEEIDRAVGLRESHLENARSLRSEGKILEADAILDAAIATNEFIEHRLGGIAKKRERLDKAVARNASERTRLIKLGSAIGKRIVDPRVMHPTEAMYNNAYGKMERALSLLEEEKQDPFAIAESLREVSNLLSAVDERIERDLEMYAEARRSVEAAAHAVAKASSLARQTLGMADNIPDSSELARMPGKITALKDRLNQVRELLDVESGDWNHLDDLADALQADANAISSEIRNEAEAGSRAVSAIQSAARKVREATNWTGSYGVRVSGRPGSRLLNDARRSLNRGDYDDAVRLAGRAKSRASSAISDAESEVRRKRRAEEERRRREEEARRAAEAARRRRMRRSSSSSSSWSSGSFGSSSSSFGGFSSSGGSSSFGGFSSSGGSSGW